MTDALAAAVVAWAADRRASSAAAVYAALVDSPLLLPAKATLGTGSTDEATGLRVDKESELALLTLTLGAPGHEVRVLPAFTTAEAMRRWRIEARPVRVPAREACRGALDQGWHGLVVDPGTAEFVIGVDAARAIAEGFVPVAGQERLSVGSVAGAELPAGPSDDVPQTLVEALRRALAREPAIEAAWLLSMQPGLEIGLVLRAPVDQAGLAVIADRLGRRLAPEVTAAGGLTVAALEEATVARVAEQAPRIWP